MVVFLLFLSSQPPFSCSGAARCDSRCGVRSAGPVATQSRVDGRPLRACLTGNRCVSSQDEGPPHKHYWRTSAACHNRSGAHPPFHPSADLESGCRGAPSSTGGPAHQSLTPEDAGNVWSRHLPASARPAARLADEEKTLQRV